MGNQALYQVAIGLIPGLFFGSALIERRQDAAKTLSGRGPGIVVAIAVVMGVVAQIIAIRGAIDPNLSDKEQRFVVFVIVAGTIGIAIFAAAPWLSQAVDVPRTRAAWGFIIVVVVGGVIGAQLAISDSLDDATARSALDNASERSQKTNETRNATESSANEARRSLLETIRTLQSTPRAVTLAATGYLDELDEALFTDELRSRSEARLQAGLKSAVARVNQAEHSFRESVEDVLPEAEAELIDLAAQFMSGAETSRIVAIVNDERSQRDLDDACRDAEALGCRQSK